jgi:hypothetical protein
MKVVEMCKTKELQRVSNCTGVEEKLSGVQIKKSQFVTEDELKNTGVSTQVGQVA